MNDEIVVFRTDDETINVEVRFEDETAWLTQDQMSVLFGKSKSTINEHIKNIFQEGELVESQVMRKFGNSEFTQNLTKLTNFYNLVVPARRFSTARCSIFMRQASIMTLRRIPRSCFSRRCRTRCILPCMGKRQRR